MFRRRKKIEIDQVQVEMCINTAIELDEGMKVHRRALEELDEGALSDATREQLIVQARQAAMVCRLGSLHTDRVAKLPDDVQPFGALRALQRVAFGMVALAQEPPDTTAALTIDELDGALLEEDVPEWLEWQLGYVDP